MATIGDTIGNSGMFDTLKGNLQAAGARTIQDVYDMAGMEKPRGRLGWRDIPMSVYDAVMSAQGIESPPYNPNADEEGQVDDDFSLGAAAMQPQDMMQQQQQNAPQLLTLTFSQRMEIDTQLVCNKQAEFNRLSDMFPPEEGEIKTTPTTHAALNSAYNELYTRLEVVQPI